MEFYHQLLLTVYLTVIPFAFAYAWGYLRTNYPNTPLDNLFIAIMGAIFWPIAMIQEYYSMGSKRTKDD